MIRTPRAWMIVRTLALGGLVVTANAPAQTVNSVGLGGSGLQQVAITTSDLPRAIAFYRDTLGLRLMFETNGMAFFDMNGTRLMIAQDGKRGRGRSTAIIYIDAPAFQNSVDRLRALKVPLEGGVETVQTSAEGELRLQQFVDPDGNALAVMGMVPVQRSPARR